MVNSKIFKKSLILKRRNDNEYKRLNIVYLFLLGSIGSLLEALGVALIFPLIAIISDPSIIDNSAFLLLFFDITNSENANDFILLISLFIGLTYGIKLSYLAFFYYLQSKYAAKERTLLLKEMFTNFLHIPLGFYYKKNNAEIIRNFTILADKPYTDYLLAVVNLVADTLAIIAIVLILLMFQPIITFICCAVFIPLFLLQNKVFGPKFLNMGKDIAELTSKHQKFLQQTIGNTKEIRVLKRQHFFIKEYKKFHVYFEKYKLFYEYVNRLPQLLTEFILISTIFVVIGYILTNIDKYEYALANLALLAAASFRLMPLFNRIIGSLNVIRHSAETIDILVRETLMLRTKKEELNKDDQIHFNNSFELKGVCYSYENSINKVLENINLKVNKGEYIGLIGPTGSGKSTMIDIILGLLKPNEGHLLIDGKTFDQYWRPFVGYVPQEVYVTDGTLRSNIAFGIEETEIDDTRVLKALELARFEDTRYSESLDLGMTLTENGTNLSGGQRQRIAIARALYHDPDIIIFDEATSALDERTENEVTDTILSLKGKKTIVSISHNIQSLRGTDRIIILNSGKIESESKYELITNENS